MAVVLTQLKKLTSWFILFLLTLIITTLMPLVQQPAANFVWTDFLISVFISFSIWRFIGAVQRIFNQFRLTKCLFSLILAILFVLLITSSVMLFYFFKTYITGDMLTFLMASPESLSDYASTYFFNLYGLLFLLAIVAVFLFIQHYDHHLQIPLTRRKWWSTVIQAFLCLCVFFITLNNFNAFNRFIMMDVSFYMGAKRYLALKNQKTLSQSFDRAHPNTIPQKSHQAFNVVLVINESMGKSGLLPYDSGANPSAMPFYNQWLNTRPSQFLFFKQFYVNSSATEVSMSSMLTGVGAHESYNKLHQTPFLWNWFDAAGYDTLYLSSQRYNWANFDKFFFNPSHAPKIFEHAGTMKLAIVNDLGGDDLKMLSFFDKHIQKTNKPFFAILNTNALHVPHQTMSKNLLTQPKFKERYQRSLFIIDKSIERLYQSIVKKGALDNTIFIFTGDHGEHGLRGGSRLTSLFREITNIPLIIFLPESWITQNKAAFNHLSVNQNTLTDAVDIAPTLIDLIDHANIQNRTLTESLIGQSLLRPREKRMKPYSIATNVNSIRNADRKTFSIYFNNGDSFIYRNFNDIAFYDRQDVKQQNNIWKRLDNTRKQVVLSIIAEHELIRNLYSSSR